MRIQRAFCHFLSSLFFFNLTLSFLESPNESNDAQLSHYMMSTWAKVCQAMGHEFEPYLPVVMPSLLATASAKADLSLYGAILFLGSFNWLFRQPFRQWGRSGRRTRRMGDDRHGWTDIWHKNICHGREVPGIRDSGYLLLDTWPPLCTLSFTNSWSNLTLSEILLPWRCTRSMCNVSPNYVHVSND